MDLRIDNEFQSLIPPLSAEEHELLEASIIKDGCRENLIRWGDILIDGHHRYAICEANSVPYQTTNMHFADRNEAKIWIIENQFGRRNISDMVRAELATQLKPLIAAIAVARQKTGKADLTQKSEQGRNERATAAQIAKKAGVSRDTIHKVEKITASPVKQLARFAREEKVSINAAAAVASLPEQQQREVVEAGPQAIKAKAKEIQAGAKTEVDTNKWPVKLRAIFAEAVIFDEALNHLTQLSKLVNQITGGNEARKGNGSPMGCGVALANEFQRVAAMAKDLRALITLNRPENICPYCRAEKQKCEYCRSGGWVTKLQWDTAPKKLKDEVAA